MTVAKYNKPPKRPYDGTIQAHICDVLAKMIARGDEGFLVTVPDAVIRDAFLELYRQRHPGLPEPRVTIEARK